jgi:hypothetical protein
MERHTLVRMAKLTWEELARDDDSDIVTWRAKVPGGWLVTVWAARDHANATGAARPGGSNWGGGLTFVPSNIWSVEVAQKGARQT